MSVVVDTYTCLTCTGCDPHGCGGAQCTFECRAVHAWVLTGPCPEGGFCQCPEPETACDEGNVGGTAGTPCGSTLDCGQVTCLKRCVDHGGGVYTWDDLVTCAGEAACACFFLDFNAHPENYPCDAGHVNDEVTDPCADDCSPVNCEWTCEVVDYELAKTADCPAGCICPDSLGPCDAGHSGEITHTDCADPNWA